MPPPDHIETLINRVQTAVVFIRASPPRAAYMLEHHAEHVERLTAKARTARLAYEHMLKAQNRANDEAAEEAKADAEQAATDVQLAHEAQVQGLVDHIEHADDQDRQSDVQLSDAAFVSELEHKAIITRANRMTLRNATRWSSTFLMLQRFYLMYKSVNQTLNEYQQPTFSQEEIRIIVIGR